MNVQVIRKVGIASGVVLAGTSAACGATDATTIGTTSSANLTESDAVAPGSGYYLLTPYSQTYVANNGGDEYVRTGESLTFQLQFADAWQTLNPADYECQDCPSDLNEVKVTVNIWFKKNGQNVSSKSLRIKWGAASAEASGSTEAMIVPPGVDQFYISYDVLDTKSGTKQTTQYSGNYDTPVYGGDAPDKNVIFDTNGPSYRQRTIEGGALVAGANATFVYTDWRADTLVNRIGLNTQIGSEMTYSRFGSGIVALNGAIQYEVSAEISYDNGATWSAIAMNEVDNGDQILPKLQFSGTGRVGYENKVEIPGDSTGVQLAFHVIAVLVADYTNSYDVTWKKYNQGDRITLADVWDNNNGANYSVAVASP